MALGLKAQEQLSTEVHANQEYKLATGHGDQLCPSPGPFPSRHFAEWLSAHRERSRRAQQLSHRSVLRHDDEHSLGRGLAVCDHGQYRVTDPEVMRPTPTARVSVTSCCRSRTPRSCEMVSALPGPRGSRPTRSPSTDPVSAKALTEQLPGPPHCAFSIRPTGQAAHANPLERSQDSTQ